MTRLDDVNSATAKLVLLYLEERGPVASIEDMHEDLDLPRLSLHGILDQLSSMDAVARDGDSVSLVGATSTSRTADD